jgi:hypothetical protein
LALSEIDTTRSDVKRLIDHPVVHLRGRSLIPRFPA